MSKRCRDPFLSKRCLELYQLREAVKEKKYTDTSNRDKRIEVFTLAEFITWANRILR